MEPVGTCSSVVEFGAGSGHLGLLLAYLRPDTTVVLVETKAFSTAQARARVKALALTNCQVFEGTVDQFAGTGQAFDLAVGLHTCGLLADAVLALAVDRRAAVCLCPCCYGQTASFKQNHDRGKGTSIGMHPCSAAFIAALSGGKSMRVFATDMKSDNKENSADGYDVPPPPVPYNSEGTTRGDCDVVQEKAPKDALGAFPWCAKAADFTPGRGSEFEEASAGFRTALRCMRTVDSDRLCWAREHNYDGKLGILEPPNCSPKCSVVRMWPLSSSKPDEG